MKVGVLMGGISTEREISLKSGEGIVASIDGEKYDVVPVVIDSKDDVINKVKDLDFAFLALHGKFGEDGSVQSVLETLGIPYSGCGPMTSAICMDKDMTKKVLKASDIRTARWTMARSIENIDFDKIEDMGYPVVVKPNGGGSSVATNLAHSREEVINAVKLALDVDKEVMIEEYIKGDEITCCMINRKMYPVIAIKPTGEFFDFASKYDAGGAEEVVVTLDENLHKEVERLAVACWDALKCESYVRVDMIIKDGVPYILELNTLPGMTEASLFPKSAKAAGLSYDKLITTFIEESLKIKR
ncbi:D-alanine--D-alanine ligase [Clostridium bornimense]|uniref:D-alanine--D-alanine ligase n=1 Tax=Clostridium bornimense TaxID=1216932 RepID=UPI001C11C97F|nr:D-alanine--D-alanine ligase [Clostridium bornimense]MBU5315985.1 D-alanine--D-alanine ligase [Clostridium bornimense]